MLRLLIRKTAWEMDSMPHKRSRRQLSDKVSMCNYWANRLGCEAADRAMQVHGGIGYSRHKPFEHIYRHHRRYRITEGSEEIQMRKVAAFLFGYRRRRPVGNEDAGRFADTFPKCTWPGCAIASYAYRGGPGGDAEAVSFLLLLVLRRRMGRRRARAVAGPGRSIALQCRALLGLGSRLDLGGDQPALLRRPNSSCSSTRCACSSASRSGPTGRSSSSARAPTPAAVGTGQNLAFDVDTPAPKSDRYASASSGSDDIRLMRAVRCRPRRGRGARAALVG